MFNLKDLQSAYFGLLTEAKIDDMLEKSDLSPYQQKLIKNINNQLSNKTKYVKFLINNIENIHTLDAEDLLYIEKFSQAFPGLDTDKITIDEIHKLIEAHKVKKGIEKIHPEAEKIFEDEDVFIVSPLTYEAAVHHGKGTNWCISTSNHKHWDRYTKNSEKFYFIISKKYPITHRFSKVAVQIKLNGSIGEFRDKNDEMINGYSIGIYNFDKYKQYLKRTKVTIDEIIKKYGLQYNESTGLYDCAGSVVINHGSLLVENGKFIVNFGHVKGDFYCSHCTSLISLEGAPKKVDCDFYCSHCTSLTSLKGCPEKINGHFYCYSCTSLTSLEGAPKEVGEIFDCHGCTSITSLNGCPEKVGEIFDCHGCSSLASLEGAPEKVGGNFDCSECTSLTSLEGAPKEVGGSFYCHNCEVEFTIDDVRKVCKVKWSIIVKNPK